MSKYKEEVDGNVLQTGINIQNTMLRLARPIFITSGRYEEEQGLYPGIKLIKFRAPNLPGGTWLGIITANIEGEACVAFHEGDTFVESVKGLLHRLNNGSLKWKEDNYG
jgi:hypothetical protein